MNAPQMVPDSFSSIFPDNIVKSHWLDLVFLMQRCRVKNFTDLLEFVTINLRDDTKLNHVSEMKQNAKKAQNQLEALQKKHTEFVSQVQQYKKETTACNVKLTGQLSKCEKSKEKYKRKAAELQEILTSKTLELEQKTTKGPKKVIKVALEKQTTEVGEKFRLKAPSETSSIVSKPKKEASPRPSPPLRRRTPVSYRNRSPRSRSRSRDRNRSRSRSRERRRDRSRSRSRDRRSKGWCFRCGIREIHPDLTLTCYECTRDFSGGGRIRGNFDRRRGAYERDRRRYSSDESR